MYLVQVLLPLRDNEGRPFGRVPFDRVRAELTERFGGVTAYLQSPAEGAWREPGGDVDRDDVVILEVMAGALDRAWWVGYREELERRFRQDEVVVRAMGMERL
ncbi:MAG TPA: hypothetical protein VHG51_02825 [Longimicrobiaceae bacterium]|nr:hypothetical protein [Longimicrobiaceae bacterium]